jgi:hypothetical protein
MITAIVAFSTTAESGGAKLGSEATTTGVGTHLLMTN